MKKKNLTKFEKVRKKGREIRKRAVNPVALARTQGFNITNMLYYYNSKKKNAGEIRACACARYHLR
jgi:hypothetical protein